MYGHVVLPTSFLVSSSNPNFETLLMRKETFTTVFVMIRAIFTNTDDFIYILFVFQLKTKVRYTALTRMVNW